MTKKINARAARLIRIGIMSMCTPYEEGKMLDEKGQTYYFTVLSFSRLWAYEMDYMMNRKNPLVQKARRRTDAFTRTFDGDGNG